MYINVLSSIIVCAKGAMCKCFSIFVCAGAAKCKCFSTGISFAYLCVCRSSNV